MRSKKTIRKALLCMSINEATDYTHGLEEALERIKEIYKGAGCQCVKVTTIDGTIKREECPMCAIGKILKGELTCHRQTA